MKNYNNQNGCHNCEFVFIYYDFDACDDFFCTKGASKRPMSLSIAMEDCPEVVTEEDCNAWTNWSAERRVMAFGICDDWEATK